MTRWLHDLRENRTAAFVLPLLLFLLLTLLTQEPVLIENSLQPWYRHAPEQWVYPLQCLAAGAVLLFFRRHYTFAPWRGLVWASAAALLGIAVWILPGALHAHWNLPQEGPLRWLGFQDRSEGGFDPTFFREHRSLYLSALGLRFFRMVIIVPLIEEIFWRGFLMRVLYDWHRDFWQVPFGSFSWVSLLGTSLAFTLVHQPADYAAAFIYGTLAGWVAIRTRSLGACIWMHALANLILGIYIVRTGNWGLW